jgi:nitrate/nitrite transporter NarK
MKRIWIALGICLIAIPVLEIAIEAMHHSYKTDNIVVTVCLGFLGMAVITARNKMFPRVNKNYFYH